MKRMNFQKFRKIQFVIGLLISVFFLVLTLNGISWINVFRLLVTAKYIFILPAILIHFISFYVRAYKWSIITNRIKPVSTRKLFPLIAIGLTINNIFPLRAGEISRIFLLSNKFHISKVNSGLTIFTERIFDIIGLLIIIVSLINLHKFGSKIHELILYSSVFLIIIIALIIPLVIFAINRVMSHNVFLKLKDGIVKKVIKKLGEFKNIYYINNNAGFLFKVVTLSILLWVLEGIGYYILSFTFGIQISLINFVLIGALVNLSSAIPASAGNIGTFEFFTTSLLVLFSIPKNLALSYALILHLEILVPISILGVYIYFRHDYHKYMSLRQIEEEGIINE